MSVKLVSIAATTFSDVAGLKSKWTPEKKRFDEMD
jgi:hypothetical protein